jgi:hypothetical protein
MPKQCHRNLNDHCCHLLVEGKSYPCPFLEKSTEEGFVWTCGLRKELGNWDLVHSDPRYQEHVQPFWDEHRDRINQHSCGTYTCENCID